MGLFSRLFSRSTNCPPNPSTLATLDVPLAGWDEEQSNDPMMRVWRRSDGGALTATLTSGGSLPQSDLDAFRADARRIAQTQGAGLLEASFFDTPVGRGGRLIYKKLRGTGFVFSGMLLVPAEGDCLAWMVILGETGITGRREAAVTINLFNAGALTLESYTESWARDPYDPTYAGVDRRSLRYESDDERYDVEFPFHALTQVRSMLTELAQATCARR